MPEDKSKKNNKILFSFFSIIIYKLNLSINIKKGMSKRTIGGYMKINTCWQFTADDVYSALEENRISPNHYSADLNLYSLIGEKMTIVPRGQRNFVYSGPNLVFTLSGREWHKILNYLYF